MMENEKDYGAPAFEQVYVALSLLDADSTEDIAAWLNENGFANLTCCPRCHVDDFTHVEGCSLARLLKGVETTETKGEEVY